MRRSRVSRHRCVTHKSRGGILKSIPKPVDPMGNAPNHLTTNTVALSETSPKKMLLANSMFRLYRCSQVGSRKIQRYEHQLVRWDRRSFYLDCDRIKRYFPHLRQLENTVVELALFAF
jgi:hypothetical protein